MPLFKENSRFSVLEIRFSYPSNVLRESNLLASRLVSTNPQFLLLMKATDCRKTRPDETTFLERLRIIRTLDSLTALSALTSRILWNVSQFRARSLYCDLFLKII